MALFELIRVYPRLSAAKTLFGFLTCFVSAAVGDSPSKPNIVLIMADDFGYECVTANGGKSYQTPHLDRLAHEGLRFDHCFVQPLCTPTRVQLMTGQYNVRNYARFGFLDPKEITFAYLARGAGYATSIVGKWQLANGFDGPKTFGFDDYCLWQLTRRPSRYANPGLEINGRAVDFANGEYGPDLTRQHALDFISKHKNQPFLLYYPMMLTHAPFQPTPDSKNWDKTTKGEEGHNDVANFADMVRYMDKEVGALVDHIDRCGLREKTLILFLGDNGTGRPVTSKFLDKSVPGGKGTLTDAGTHVPLIARWPGKTPAGKVCGDLVDSTDFLPTIAAALGVELPKDRPIDGRSFLPQLCGEKGTPREWSYCWYSPNQNRVNVPRQFARTQRYRLHDDGAFFRLDSPKHVEEQLELQSLTDEAKAAKGKLEGVLASFKTARPDDLANLAPTPKKAKAKKKAKKADR